eukprot:GHVP01025170.1.p1 GENE.GHVP01025170.1~~GHVP01025170.1.p1  ORF type:complete len:253 (+),score=36.37 GHVP01025170.1:90-848(+)
MEAKILFDQLNSACEDYGIPEENGFTFQDDLHQGDSVEPEFRGLITRDGSHFVALRDPRGRNKKQQNILRRMNFVNKKFVEVFLNLKDYKLTPLPKTCEHYMSKPLLKAYDAVVNFDNERETIFGFDHEDRGGLRFWTIRLCNCLKSDEAKELFKRRCTGEECHKFEISWKTEEKAFDLWYAFEVVPQVYKYRKNFAVGKYAGMDSFPKCLDPASLKREFDEVLQQIKATASDNSDTSDVRVCDKKRAEQPL